MYTVSVWGPKMQKLLSDSAVARPQGRHALLLAGVCARTVWNLTGSVSSSVGSMCAQDLLEALMPYRNTLQAVHTAVHR
jgi:hypothetical protein